MSRRAARELCLQMMFQLTVGANDWAQAERWLAEAELGAEESVFAAALVKGALDELPASDALIDEFTRDWQLERLAEVDKALLRLAVFELKAGATPASIVINEAVELAKVYGGDDSPAFVNAVLDNIRATYFPAAAPEQAPAADKEDGA